MTTSTCPKGHDSATLDYCDTCGSPMAAPPPDPEQTQPVPAPPAAPDCPLCGTPQAGRFCEVDGHDFLLAPSGPVPERAAAPPPAEPERETGMEVVVGADRAWFDGVVAQGGEDADGMVFPRFVVERRFALTGERLLIGRRSRSRGVHPDVDLSGPPEDPGVSHTHAMLVHEGGKWSIVDLGSANGTYVNDPASAAIPAETPVPLRPGDRVYVGAWTSLTVREAQ
ncbi:FHA domain-containing protein [Catenuloplanes atrovinosus]|uniref:FHA domain-containing protein n=1 Tax=Catenuloplanes atrovinosus TaxID=137266 RepID=A0AAE4CBS2_9ACTN|nr:FHA domain-containing protein [Catenuloplanes atrovinosus]MDR7275865.1 hypothetical protein [Catenuloplanes atrovinosus]